MIVKKFFFPKIQKDNHVNYFQQLEGVIESVDELCSLQITYTGSKYIFRLAPSHIKYIDILIEEIAKYHSMLGIKLEFSKSIKTTAVILFHLPLGRDGKIA